MCDILTSVKTTVSPKTTNVGKHLLTDLTFVRHPRMDALDVCGETVLPGEAFIAVPASVCHSHTHTHTHNEFYYSGKIQNNTHNSSIGAGVLAHSSRDAARFVFHTPVRPPPWS